MNTDINYKNLLDKIRCFVFDVDGVMTDGSLLIQPDGTMYRTMNIKDGYAMQLAIKKGYQIFVISGSTPEGVKKRLERLGLTEIHIGIENKLDKLNELLAKHKFQFSDLLYMGDDMPDLEVLKKCALRTCPSDAVYQIKNECQFVSTFPGGKGCVRDIIEQVLQLNGDWE
ncbi:MAG: 3-deoxy-D-manno-octulosonate 8-phosphate phosphatase [Bacteroidia bacterium]|jgi:3-deoxy-D-manno-octulosonate 8-phosphate phosphatase (KDO 8-P phosphatase)|nr:3-deoxy-D-manno-octulosonate 8-phosphate phosphatase [Bacteroidota bacterium]MBP6511676.1 3-deoxy-D-manno-octulosonate 8-phosphate phosphatase [Bacteroidia bacterium]MBP7244813.1 3-deoxy-D-manno-octulosonate 8-phosphate phosphatase [Bacteroidia bacterium]